MKLKLEVQEGVSILVITEDIAPQHCAILRAGLTKIFQTGKKNLLLDLTGVTEQYEALSDDLAVLQALAPEHECSVYLCGKLEGVRASATRAEAIQHMKTHLYGLESAEAIAQAKLRRLEAEKAGLEAQLSASAESETEIRTLRLENSELKRIETRLEAQILALLNGRAEPAQEGVMAGKREKLDQTLVAVLEQEGILPVT